MKDMIIFIPNAAGFILGLIQLLLCVFFPRHKDEREENVDGELIDNDDFEHATHLDVTDNSSSEIL